MLAVHGDGARGFVQREFGVVFAHHVGEANRQAGDGAAKEQGVRHFGRTDIAFLAVRPVWFAGEFRRSSLCPESKPRSKPAEEVFLFV